MKLAKGFLCGLICLTLALVLVMVFAPVSDAAGNNFHYPVGYSNSLSWKVTQSFNSTWSGKHHTGVDLSTSGANGKPVYATAAGTVVYSGSSSGWGNVIVIRHSFRGTYVYSLYGHLSVRLVSKGKAVSARQRIGSVGNTGYSTGPHLHFEIKRQACVDKYGLLGPGYTSASAGSSGYYDPISFVKTY